MADILLLSSCPTAAENVRRAVRRDAAGGVFHALRSARGWAELVEMASAAALAVAVVDPYHGGAFAAAEIRRLRDRAPAVEVLALTDFSRRPAADAFSLALLGVREMVCTGGGADPSVLARCLREHLNRNPLEEMVKTLAAEVPAPVRRWLAPALLSGEPSLGVADLARAARCSPRTLRRAVGAADLPSPERLLAWRRLLHAARLLDDGRSADSVARALGFSSGSALRKSLKQLTGLRPRDLPRGDGLRLLAGRFLRECGSRAAAAAGGAREEAARMAGTAPRMAVRDTGAGRRGG